MTNQHLRDAVMRFLPGCRRRLSIFGGELNSVVKDRRQVRGGSAWRSPTPIRSA